MVIYGFYSVDCGKFIPSIVGKLFRGLWIQRRRRQTETAEAITESLL